MSSPNREKAKWTDKAIVLLTFGLVIVAMIQGWIFKQQRDEMHSAGVDTQNLVSAAQQQAAAAGRFSAAADRIDAKIAQAQVDMVTSTGKIKKTIDTAEKDLRDMATSSKESIEAARDSMRLDQRAWLGIGQFRITQFEDGKSLKLEIETRNSGKTPAVFVTKALLSSFELNPSVGPPEIGIRKLEFSPWQSVPPSGSQTILMEIPWTSADNIVNGHNNGLNSFYPRIKNKTTFISFYGELKYRDIFSPVIHTTQVCIWLKDPDTRQLVFCDSFNEMN